MKRLLLASLFLSITFIEGHSQQLPLYTQYVFNPYMINPSMVAFGNRPEANLFYRQQWANIQNGPKTLQADFQYPLNNKMAIGFNVNNDKTVLLSSTSLLLTYGYKIQLAANHQLGFGLSAGAFSNKVNLDEVAPADLPDPALLTSLNNSIVLDGQFGIHYSFKKFVLGYSLVNLLERKALSTRSLQDPKLAQLKNQILFASYRFTIAPETWYLQPNVAYRFSQDNFNYAETSLLVSYRNRIDVGGGYRQDFGPSALVRVHVKRLQVGFAYDFPSTSAQVSTGGTREIQLKWLFGKLDDEPQKKPKKNSTQKPKEEKLQPEAIEPEKQNQDKKDVVEVPQQKIEPEPLVKEEAKPEVQPEKVEVVPDVPKEIVEPKPQVQTEQKENENEGSYYFIVGAFENEANAMNLVRMAKQNGLKVKMKESKQGKVPHLYYVHIPEYKSKEISLEKLVKLRKATKIMDAWFSKLD
jgi:type IX secretion system PorP/SprF family membrane protein